VNLNLHGMRKGVLFILPSTLTSVQTLPEVLIVPHSLAQALFNLTKAVYRSHDV